MNHPAYPYHTLNRNRRIFPWKFARAIGWIILALFALGLSLFCLSRVLATSENPYRMGRDLTQQEREWVAGTEKRFKLKGYFWGVNRTTGEISYFRKEVLRTIK